MGTALGIRMIPNWERSSPSRPMMASAESGEVLLTTCIGEIFGNVLVRIVPGDVALDEFVSESELAQLGKFRRLPKAEDFPVVESTGELDQKTGLTLRLGNTQRPLDFTGDFEGQ